MLREYDRRRKLIISELNLIKSAPYVAPKGAFYVFPNFSTFEKSDEALAQRLLMDARVVTVPGSSFGTSGEGHLRISYSISYEQAEKGMERIRRCLNRKP
jgi:aminotransferase